MANAAGPVAAGATVDQALVVGRPCRRQGERNRPESELELPVAARRLRVVIALRCGTGDDLDLALVEAEALVDGGGLRLDGAIVGQEDARRAAFEQRRGDRRALDVGQRLGGEHDSDILLP